MGRPTDPHYWRKWRAAHPEARAKDAARKRRWRAAMTPEQRAKTHGAYRPVVPAEPMPVLHLGHPLLDEARAIAERVSHPDRRTYVYDATFDDLVGELVLALLEERDPWEVARHFMATEFGWRLWHATGCEATD